MIQQQELYNDLLRRVEAAGTVTELDSLSRLWENLTGTDKAAGLAKLAAKREQLVREGKV